jgi:nucleotide-binding universal stress UspA family protein
MRMPQRILVPTDFSEYGETAVEYAVQLATRLDATVQLLHVVTFPTYGVPELGVARANALVEEAVASGKRKLDDLAARLRGRIELAPVRVEIGDARETIDRIAAESDADLIVMGTHGRRGVSRWFLGSVAETVVRTAPCPVLTVHREAA